MFDISRMYESVPQSNYSCTVVDVFTCYTSVSSLCVCVNVCVCTEKHESEAKVKTYLASRCSRRSFLTFIRWSMLLSADCTVSSNGLQRIKTHWRDWELEGQWWQILPQHNSQGKNLSCAFFLLFVIFVFGCLTTAHKNETN